MSMFSNIGLGLYRERDQFSLENAQLYLRDQNGLQNFILFVNSIPLKGGFREYDDLAFTKAKAAFEKGVTQYGVKMVRPLRTLLMRVLNQNIGFIDLHTYFLRLCNRFSVPREALPILQFPGLFKNISKRQICQFLVEGCDIYLKLREYAKANDLLNRSHNIQFIDPEVALGLYQRQILLDLVRGGPVSVETKERMRGLSIRFEHYSSMTMTEDMKRNMLGIVQFFVGLNTYRKLEKNEEVFMKQSGLLEIYNDSKFSSLAIYIDKEIKGRNWRIKAESIKDTPVGDLEVIRGINTNKEIYRYDSKAKIMYFNHKESSQDGLNDLITNAMTMSQEVNNCKIEKKESMRMGGGMGMGGGMSGMGGLGGMGGFGDMLSRIGSGRGGGRDFMDRMPF